MPFPFRSLFVCKRRRCMCRWFRQVITSSVSAGTARRPPRYTPPTCTHTRARAHTHTARPGTSAGSRRHGCSMPYNTVAGPGTSARAAAWFQSRRVPDPRADAAVLIALTGALNVSLIPGTRHPVACNYMCFVHHVEQRHNPQHAPDSHFSCFAQVWTSCGDITIE